MWWWGYPWFHPLIWIFPMALVGLLVSRIFMFRRHARWCDERSYGRFDAEAILKRRLASGEIHEDEYQRLKAVLEK